jgi:hypothetical protein
MFPTYGTVLLAATQSSPSRWGQIDSFEPDGADCNVVTLLSIAESLNATAKIPANCMTLEVATVVPSNAMSKCIRQLGQYRNTVAARRRQPCV